MTRLALVLIAAALASKPNRSASGVDGGSRSAEDAAHSRTADKVVEIDGGSCEGSLAMFWKEPRGCWMSEVTSKPHMGIVAGVGEGNVDCNDVATICGEDVVCECGPNAAPCSGRHVTEYEQDVRFDGGGGCSIEVAPPRDGRCVVRGATRPPEGGVADWHADVAFGETRIVGGCTPVTCSCDQFEPDDGGTRCSFRLVSSDAEGCALSVTTCGRHGCVERAVPMLRTETRELCDKPFTCK